MFLRFSSLSDASSCPRLPTAAHCEEEVLRAELCNCPTNLVPNFLRDLCSWYMNVYEYIVGSRRLSSEFWEPESSLGRLYTTTKIDACEMYKERGEAKMPV